MKKKKVTLKKVVMECLLGNYKYGNEPIDTFALYELGMELGIVDSEKRESFSSAISIVYNSQSSPKLIKRTKVFDKNLSMERWAYFLCEEELGKRYTDTTRSVTVKRPLGKIEELKHSDYALLKILAEVDENIESLMSIRRSLHKSLSGATDDDKEALYRLNEDLIKGMVSVFKTRHWTKSSVKLFSHFVDVYMLTV